MDQVQCELPRKVFLKEVESGPRTIEVDATESERIAIARRLAIDSLSSFRGSITLSIPKGRDAMIHQALYDGTVVIGNGHIAATLMQTCVVTLEPFETTLESSFEGIFTDSDPVDSSEDYDHDGMSDLPDILGSLDQEVIDIGEIFIEQLALELDPFPRKPGVEFDGFSSGKPDSGKSTKESPFAVLAKLKDNQE